MLLPVRSVAEMLLPVRSLAEMLLPVRSLAEILLPVRSLAEMLLPVRSLAEIPAVVLQPPTAGDQDLATKSHFSLPRLFRSFDQ